MQNIADKRWKLLRNMAENSGKREIKLKITEEQFWAMYHFFNYNDWDLQEATIYSEWTFDDERNGQSIRADAMAVTTTSEKSDNDVDDDADEGHNGVNDPQQDNNVNENEQNVGEGDGNIGDNGNNQQQGGICQHCFLSPCVTVYPQSWLGHGAGPHMRNAPLRKKKYKLFWKVISERGGWLHPRYVAKKQRVLHRTRDDSIVWTPREIMPDCVLNLVRGLHPNLPGQPYMGHKWW